MKIPKTAVGNFLYIDSWLSTNYGVGPKTWSTLFDKLKEVDNLSAATRQIINELE